MDPRGRFGINLRRLRTARGLSQEELAFRVEIDRGYVSDMERGKRNPTLLMMIGIARVLDVALQDLLDGIHTNG